jgi:hypothetical protein
MSLCAISMRDLEEEMPWIAGQFDDIRTLLGQRILLLMVSERDQGSGLAACGLK